jgi:hypothetical protein
MPAAAVVPSDPATANAEQFIAWLTPQLAHYKQLRDIYFVTDPGHRKDSPSRQ